MFGIQHQILTLLCFFLHHLVHTIAGNFITPYSPVDSYFPLHHNLVIPVSDSPTTLQRLLLTFGRGNAVATGFTIIISLLNILVYKLRQLQESNFDKESDTPSSSSTLKESEQSCRRFSLTDIWWATNNFDEALVIGKGGFGNVYKGVIDNGTITVAVKRLSPMSKQGAPQFRTEIELLSKFRHSNLVSLIGYCDDRDEMILVYEYMIHGALSNQLYKVGRQDNNTTLSWVQRLKICIGVAHGLDYLHTGTGVLNRVIHRDLKSANILLDENWAAKISDFGLSKIGPANQSCTSVSTHVKGTFGYLDPEYVWRRRLTRKSDVYSFGVVLLEVLSGRRAVDLRLYEDQMGFVGWARQCIKNGTVDEITDPSLRCQILRNSSGVFAKIADQCLHYRSKKRPTMAEVVASIEFVLALQEGRDSSTLEGEIFNMGGASVKQENVDYSIEQHEATNSGNGGHDDKHMEKTLTLHSSNRMSLRNPVRIRHFTKMVRQFFLRKARKASVSKVEDDDISTVESLQYDFDTIKVATENFSDMNKLGEGGFGVVYKGKLQNGLQIAVKRMSKSSTQGALEFKNEVLLVARLQHRNLVRLLGFCLEGTQRLLIYEFVPNASLDQFIFDHEKSAYLDWIRRYKIIGGVARGILYLHEDSRLRIIHRDLKASNILLDIEMNPKISDFGMARLLETDETQGNTSRIVGTYGYMAPEYAMYGQFSIKSDVFSFGVLVLEIISGQRNHCIRNRQHVEDILSYAWKNWRAGTCHDFIDPILRHDAGSIRDIMRCIHIGLLSVQENVANRPTMPSIVLMLNNSSHTLPVPLKPAFFTLSNIDPEMPLTCEHDSGTKKNSQQKSGLAEFSIDEDPITDVYPR